MRKICDYFGVEFHEVMLPAEEFDSLIRVRGVPDIAPRQWLDEHLGKILRTSEDRALELRGMFFEYYFSMAIPGSILRSLIIFEERDGFVFYRRLERIGPADRVCRRHFRYQGVAVMLGDRIFLTDYEYGLKLELTQTILYPDYKKRVSTLIGVKLGVAAHQQRTPCCTRVYLERTPSGSTCFSNLRECGLFPGDYDGFPATIRAAINNRSSGPHNFLAHIAE